MTDGFKTQSPLENLAWRLQNTAKVVSVLIPVFRMKTFSDDELVRLARSISYGFKPDEDILLAAIRFHFGERMTELEAVELAGRLAGEDSVLRELLIWSMHCNGFRVPDAPSLRDGVWFWQVGRNASHEFYAGTDGNGKRFRYSAGEGCELPDGTPTLEVSDVKEVADWSGYFGHF